MTNILHSSHKLASSTHITTTLVTKKEQSNCVVTSVDWICLSYTIIQRMSLQFGYKWLQFGYKCAVKDYKFSCCTVTSWIHLPVRMRRAHRGVFSRHSAWMAAATHQ